MRLLKELRMNRFDKEPDTEGDDLRSSSLTEILSLLFVTIILLTLFFKILFG